MLDLWMPYNYMFMLILMTLTLMQGHSGSAKAENQCCILSRQLSIKRATTVGHFDVILTFANVYVACPACFYSHEKCECQQKPGNSMFVNSSDCLSGSAFGGTEPAQGCFYSNFSPQWGTAD